MSGIFTAWRADIEANLEDARKQLEADLKKLKAAEAAAAIAKTERRQLTDAMVRLPANVVLSGELANRMRERDDVFRQADGALLRARNGVTSSGRRIADLEEALQQLGALIPAEEAETTA